MTKDWPPPGHRFSYRVDEALDNGYRISYDLSLPSGAGAVDLATVRVGRHGGDSPEDLTFREELYQSVGSITVAGGHVEAAMKRLLLLLIDAETDFSLVDYQWYELETKLRAQCDGSDERRRRLLRILDGANRHKLRERRHTVVHGAWWIYAGVGARMGRWPRKENGRAIIDDMACLRQLGKECWAYAYRLDDLGRSGRGRCCRRRSHRRRSAVDAAPEAIGARLAASAPAVATPVTRSRIVQRPLTWRWMSSCAHAERYHRQVRA